MDPITRTLVNYDRFLSNGGTPVHLNTATKRTIQRKLHPSALGPWLCDRKACYDIMRDMGEIEVADFSNQQLLSFRVGHVFQDFVAQALTYAGWLYAVEFELEDERRKKQTGAIQMQPVTGQSV